MSSAENQSIHDCDDPETMDRIHFPLQPDQDGYPPYGCETLWAKQVSQTHYELDNIPFYIRGISAGALVSVKKYGNELHFNGLKQPSENSTLRIIFFNDDHRQPLLDWLSNMGCSTEGHPPLIAINIPAAVDFARVIEHIADHKHTDRWDYEEAAISASHKAQL